MKCTLLLYAIAFPVLSCQKSLPGNRSKKDLLTTGAWRVQKAEEKENNDPWADVFPLWAACDKDNTWRFNPDLSLEYNEASLACSPNAPDQVLDIVAWSFADNDTKIISDGVTYLIEELDNNTLIISETETSGSVTSQRRITFEH